jgi:hypothetical protein
MTYSNVLDSLGGGVRLRGMKTMMMTGSYVDVRNEFVLEEALVFAVGCYQRNVLLGHEALSGATLKGKARQYGGQYKRSRENLLRRLTRFGVPWSEQIGPHGKRILVLG